MRRMRIPILLGLVIVTAAIVNVSTIRAQDVPYERAMWASENRLVAAFIAGDVDAMAKLWHEDLSYWPEGEDRPWNKRYAGKVINDWSGAENGTLSTPMLEPIGARIMDDMALTHYRLEYTVTGKDGTQTKRRLRLSHCWAQTADGWKLLGGSNTAIAR